ncbi:hypothetical protein APX70_06278 [Pseudomonas syringae pv. maculicola]|uniref:Uncharacterized protein n=1 Tax=Pseudomonas syringae pv. maculicola TaxID=59511 RepID=A0A3M2W812_PSEYM|nr:hypothetical protein APX70_06278 [Pseudomonas syringae pv. maculicola]
MAVYGFLDDLRIITAQQLGLRLVVAADGDVQFVDAHTRQYRDTLLFDFRQVANAHTDQLASSG